MNACFGTVTPVSLTQDEIKDRVTADSKAIYADQEPVTAPITFHEASARALKYNLDYRLKLLENALSKNLADVSSYEMLPRLVAGAGYANRNNDSGGRSIGIEDRVESLRPSTSQERDRALANLTFSWNALDFGVSYYRAQQKADQFLMAEERRRKVAQNVLQDVRNSYWRALSAQRLLDRVDTLLERVAREPNITVFEHHMLLDVITDRTLGLATTPNTNRCHGVYALDEAVGEVNTFSAPHTILATGGAGKVYLYTTNPDTATGDGIAAAWRAGCRVGNMEFIQFHPTGLYHPHAKSFLISEAVRGEGGRLLLPDGTRFMPQHDERAELAPRDVVARAIDYEMKRHGLDCVHLDISHQSPEFLHEHFPNILAHCASLGIDITKEPIPVVPTAHFTCGGVLTDLAGRTDLPGLYAVGEVACTGLHGANRLASNSLLECMVFARAAAHAIAATPCTPVPELPGWDDSRVQDADESVVISHNWDELRRFMWDYVGIVRTNKRLERAAHRIALLQAEIQEFYAHFHITRDLLELRNLVQVADLIIKSAQMRRESRGLHYSRDYPALAAPAAPTILVPPVARH